MINPHTPKADASLFERVIFPHWSAIYRGAYRLCGSRATAEDLTQETFFVAFQKFDQLKDHEKARSWLFVILRHLFLGHVERERAKLYSDFDEISYKIEDKFEEASRDEREGLSDDVKLPLDRLDAKFKEPLLMAVVGQYSYKEIADNLGIPIGTVMSRISRGKTFLKREVSKQLKQGQTLPAELLSF